MTRTRLVTPDLNQHLGFPARDGEAYRAKHTHSDIDRVLDGLPAPATTVVAATVGQTPKVGTSEDYARADHAHGTPEGLPYCEIHRTTSQTISASTFTYVTFDTTNDATLDLRSGNSIVIQKAGRYTVWYNIFWDSTYSDATYGGYRAAMLLRNGNHIVHDHDNAPITGGATDMTHNVSKPMSLAVGDVLQVQVYQKHPSHSLSLTIQGGTHAPYLGVKPAY